MAINFDQNRAGLINLSRNINNNQMAFVPDFLKNIFTGNPEDIQIGEEGSPIDKAKDALEKNKQKELPSAEDVLKGNISSLDLPSNNLTAMAIKNYDDLFAPKTLTDAFGVNRTILGLNRPDLNTEPFNVNEVSTDGITNNVRFRDMLLNDIRNLPSDIRTSLGQTKNKFLEDISGLTKGLGSIRDTGMNLFGLAKNKTIDLGGMIKRGIGNAIFPGLGFLIGNVKESPTDKFNLQIGKEIGDPYGYKGQLTSGTLGARQDPFGRNLVSMFSDYEKNRMAEVAKLSALENLNKFQQAQLDFGKDYLDKLEAKRQEAINKSFESKSSGGGGGNKGADFTGGRFDRAGSRAAYDANPTGFSGSS